MKIQFALALSLVAIFSSAQAINVGFIFQNLQYIEHEIHCVLGRTPCYPIGRKFQDLLCDVVNTNCRKCTPLQRYFAELFVSFMTSYYPEKWDAITKLYSNDNYENKPNDKNELSHENEHNHENELNDEIEVIDENELNYENELDYENLLSEVE